MLPAVFCVLLCALLIACLVAERRRSGVLCDELCFARGQERRLEELLRTRSAAVDTLEATLAVRTTELRTERREDDLRRRALQRLLTESLDERDQMRRERIALDKNLEDAYDEIRTLCRNAARSVDELREIRDLAQVQQQQADEREERHAAAIANLERLLEEARTVRDEALAMSEADRATAEAVRAFLVGELRGARESLRQSREREREHEGDAARAEHAFDRAEAQRVALLVRLNNQQAEVVASREDARVAWEALHRQQQNHHVFIGQVEARRDAALAERDAALAALERERRISDALRGDFDRMVVEATGARAGTRRARAPDDLERHVRARAATEM
jgi:DNA repair exonuclease SbcCD ATPase subunit